MLGIYAKTFMTASRLSHPRIRPLKERDPQQRRWKAGRWMDPPEEF